MHIDLGHLKLSYQAQQHGYSVCAGELRLLTPGKQPQAAAAYLTFNHIRQSRPRYP
jgi:hypothetical protein